MSNLPVTFDASGLVPVDIQDDTSSQVLMMAFMDREALDLTRETGEVHFWSRSRGKLWHKGETSGHVQHVRSISINCNEDSLLIRVEQIGACCHTGHETCYYRELAPDGDLVTHGEPLFDPGTIYQTQGAPDDFRIWAGAYGWLEANDLSEVSGTSRLLHTSTTEYLAGRVADELVELIGVVAGTHTHTTPAEDVVLEGSQVLYWMAMAALRSGADVVELAADVHRGGQAVASPAVADLLVLLDGICREWRSATATEVVALVDRTVPLIAQASQYHKVPFQAVIEKDLADLRSRPYLDPYFTGALA